MKRLLLFMYFILFLLSSYSCVSSETSMSDSIGAPPSGYYPRCDFIRDGVYVAGGWSVQQRFISEIDVYMHQQSRPIIEFLDESTLKVLSDFDPPCFPDTVFTYKYKNDKLRLKSKSGVRMKMTISSLDVDFFNCDINSKYIKRLQFMKPKNDSLLTK